MLESLELNNRDPRGREIYVRHQQVYSLLELSAQLYIRKSEADSIPELDRAIRDTSDMIAELIKHFEEATVPDRKSFEYQDNQISSVLRAVSTLENLRATDAPLASLMDAARTVLTTGSHRRFEPPRLVVSNS